MDYNCIIGIDPGENGGVSVWADGRVTVIKMPKNVALLSDALTHYRQNFRAVAFVEKLAIRHDDLQGGKVFRIRKMIANYESLKAIIALCNVDFCEVHPLTWQSRLGLRITGEEKTTRKRRYKTIASELYPQVKVTMWNCDALLIMRYGRTMLESTQRKDVRWLAGNLIINSNNSIYNLI